MLEPQGHCFGAPLAEKHLEIRQKTKQGALEGKKNDGNTCFGAAQVLFGGAKRISDPCSKNSTELWFISTKPAAQKQEKKRPRSVAYISD
jgi:hypothetical protein